MEPLIPHLFELNLNNLSLGGGIFEGKKIAGELIIEQLLQMTKDLARKLMKIKLSKLSLKRETVIQNLCDTVQYSKFVIVLDVSLSQVPP